MYFKILVIIYYNVTQNLKNNNMKWRDINKPCPCWGWLKYKKCYWSNNLQCKQYSFEQEQKRVWVHNKKEQDVLRFLTDVLQEICSVFIKTDEGIEYARPRAQLIVCFAMLDVLAWFWNLYWDLKLDTDKKEFKNWMKLFWQNPKNEANEQNKFLNDITVDQMYYMRCALVHFCWLWGEYKGASPIIMSGAQKDSYIADFTCKLSKASWKKINVIKLIEIKNMICWWLMLMMETLIENIEKSHKDDKLKEMHINGICRVYKKYQKEWAVNIEQK